MKHALGMYCRSFAVAKLSGGLASASEVAAKAGWHEGADYIRRAAIGAQTTAGGLALPDVVTQEYIADRPRNNLSSQLNKVTRDLGLWNKAVVTDDATLAAGEVSEMQPIPCAGLSASTILISPRKIGIAIPYTRELAMSGQFAAVAEQDIGLAADRGLDAANLLNPLFPGSGGYTAGTTDALADLRQVLRSLSLTGAENPLFVVDPDTAILAMTLRQGGGGFIFPEMGVAGGRMLNIETFVNDRLNPASLLAINPAMLAMHVGGIEISVSTDASMQLSTDPATGAAAMLSAFQGDLIYLKAMISFNCVEIRGTDCSASIADIAWVDG